MILIGDALASSIIGRTIVHKDSVDVNSGIVHGHCALSSEGQSIRSRRSAHRQSRDLCPLEPVFTTVRAAALPSDTPRWVYRACTVADKMQMRVIAKYW